MNPTPNPFRTSQLRRALLTWYDEHRRDLPWRRDADPYRVWVSEIMLQQTRVAAVLDHYARFLKKFPTVQTLAAAREASVLALWSGLGYYHRARRMHQAAKLIARERKGIFPRTAEEWRELPGIGRYTAAAIASIAFGEAVAVVDGNVERVLDRMFGAAREGKPRGSGLNSLLDRERPGDFNQAMMELGATVCTPRAPQCQICPLCAIGALRAAPAQCGHNRPASASNSPMVWRGKAVPSCWCSVRRMPRSWRECGSCLLFRSPTATSRLQPCGTPLPTPTTTYQCSQSRQRSFTLLAVNARWFTRRQWERLPLTGLTRKILRRLSA